MAEVSLPEEYAIERKLFEYAHAIDAADVETLLTLFSSDAVVRYDGGAIRIDGEAELGPYLRKILVGPSTHLMSNVIVDRDGDRAKAKASALICVTRNVEFFLVRGVSYTADFAKADGRWRITALLHQPIWEFRIPKPA